MVNLLTCSIRQIQIHRNRSLEFPSLIPIQIKVNTLQNFDNMEIYDELPTVAEMYTLRNSDVYRVLIIQFMGIYYRKNFYIVIQPALTTECGH